ncbi:cytochrome P450 [Sinomonas terrae]|uniref:Cytochrome P450 n=1 Tax=Sinomonas terrae TaxID=2908838 RepID=A0ABS9U139_9MICC|nr:cytochrome P450 [Sinomonas terrae]MCH6470409.1 cytochrome P450 [Sinomonas terrae]
MGRPQSIGRVPAVRLPALIQDVLLWYDPVGQLRRWARRHGDAFTVRLPAVGPILVLGDPSTARQALLSDPRAAEAGTATGRVLPVLGPACVLRQDGSAHQDRRRLLGPAFHGESLERLRTLAAENARREIRTWAEGRPIALLPRMQEVVFATMATAVLGIDDSETVQRLHRAITGMNGPSALARTWMSPVGDGAVRSWLSRRSRRRQSRVDAILAPIIDARRSAEPLGGSDVLSLLIGHERDSGSRIGQEAMNDELTALLLAGYETTAAALGWALERLARHPGAARLLAGSVDGQDSRHLDAFVREVLRWRPPVLDAVRELTTPMELAGFRVPAGTLVVVAPLLVHDNDGRVDAPDAFRPDRFLGARHRGGRNWVPFGGGRRHCLGAELAAVQMEAVLTEVVSAVTLSPASPCVETARLLGTVLVPSRGSAAVIRRRRAPMHTAARGGRPGQGSPP